MFYVLIISQKCVIIKYKYQLFCFIVAFPILLLTSKNSFFYTFNDWCEENEVYTKWDINHQYGSDGWDWEVIKDEEDEVQWLIIAVKEY